MRGLLAIASAFVLVSCQQASEVTVDNAWLRLPAAAENPGAAYFTVTGGSKADTLLSVSTSAALRTEMHESMKGDHGMMEMKPITDIAIPANAKLAFEPGGKHIMLFSISPNVKAGEEVPLSLSFASGKKVDVSAKVVTTGESAPAHR